MEVKLRHNCNLKNINGCKCFHFLSVLSCFICLGCCLYVICISNEIKYLRNELSAISKTCSQKKSFNADEKEWTPIKSRYGNNLKERRMKRNADGSRDRLWDNRLLMADESKSRDNEQTNNQHKRQDKPRKKSSFKGHRKKRAKSKQRKKRCKKICAKLNKNKGEKPDKDQAFDTGTIRDIVKKRRVMWSHFTSNFWNDVTQEMFGEHTDCINIWSGRACIDRSYTNTEDEQLLHALKDRNATFGYSSPVAIQKGQYKILHNGLYVLYFHATYWNRSKNDVLALTHTRHQKDKPTTVLRCQPSDNTFPKNDLNVVFNSCSLTNVLYMWKNDIVDFRIVKKNTVLDLSEDSTYMGIVKII